MKMLNSSDIVKLRYCLGCGACEYICPKRRIRLMDFPSEGIRPFIESQVVCDDCKLCIDVCSAIAVDFASKRNSIKSLINRNAGWGTILEIWEGNAVDQKIRFKGSSGGLLTALSAYCLEKLGSFGVLHTGQDIDDPIRNRTRLSRNRSDLIAAIGSRYSPASICNGLSFIEKAAAPCIFIGKPVEVAALRKAQEMRPNLNNNILAAFSFFCAESPCTQGTIDLLNKIRLNIKKIKELKYRGNGWPGYFAPKYRYKDAPEAQISYRESWSFLQAYRPWSTQIWPDGTGEHADISCGDPWYKEPDGRNPGSSLIVVRTEKGRQIVRGSMKAGYVELTPAEPWKLVKSQKGLIKKKGAIWGRLLIMRLFGLSVPQFKGGHLFRCWLRLSIDEKLRSTLGTIRRIITRKLYRPLNLQIDDAVAVKLPFVGGDGPSQSIEIK